MNIFNLELENGTKVSFDDFSELDEKLDELGVDRTTKVKSFVDAESLVIPCETLNQVESYLEIIDNGFMYPYELMQVLDDHYIANNGDWSEIVEYFNDMLICKIDASCNDEYDLFCEEVGKRIADREELFSWSQNGDKPWKDSVYGINFDFKKFGENHIEATQNQTYFCVDQLLFEIKD